MSANSSLETPESKSDCYFEQNTNLNSSFALYLFSNNKHASSSGSEYSGSEKGCSTSSKIDYEESNVCLSLLEGNLNAEQETVVRCYLLNALSLREDLGFENGGKYAVLNFGDDSNQSFGCYYHRLSKTSTVNNEEGGDLEACKQHTFFICLIGAENGIMDSFIPELSKFCSSIVDLLDPEGLSNKEDVQLKLKSWYSYCVEYVGRCIKIYNDDIPLVLFCSLWGNIEVMSENEEAKWDLKRFVETCSLLSSNFEISKDSMEEINSVLKLKVNNGKIEVEGKTLVPTPYCLKWFEKLKSCQTIDYKCLRSVLEGFKLKTTQDLNTLKRLLQKAVNDHYSLYNAYLFLQASGYEDILLYHVKKEATVAKETDILDVITCLHEFIEEEHS